MISSPILLTPASQPYPRDGKLCPIVEPQWNPAVEEQAIARAARMGQTRSVTVVRYNVQDSVEEVSHCHLSLSISSLFQLFGRINIQKLCRTLSICRRKAGSPSTPQTVHRSLKGQNNANVHF